MAPEHRSTTPHAVRHRADAGVRDDDLRRDERAGRRHRVDQPGPGLPGHRRPAGHPGGGPSRPSPRARTSTRPGPGAPSCGRRSPRTSSASTASSVDPETEVLVTVGATEAIAAAILALCEPGDEVVTFEPYYDSYAAAIALAGAIAADGRCCAGRTSRSTRTSCGRRSRTGPGSCCSTRPHNPTGKVFTRAELELVGRLAVEHGAIVVTDEVYEHLVFDGLEHVPVATLPGMADRTLTISSAGKTFSVTGWKVGWVSGPRRARGRGAGRQAVPDLRRVGAVPAGRRRRPGPRRRGLLRGGRVAAVPARPALGWAGLGRLRGRPGRRHLLRGRRPPPARATTTGSRCAARCPTWPGWSPCRSASSTTTRTPRPSLVRFAFCKREPVLLEAVERLHRLRR